MSRLRPHVVLAVSLCLALPAHAAQAPATDAPAAVTIYRCIGADGAVALRDSPCRKGERQEVRSMQRPRDPAPVPAAAVTAAPAPASAPTVKERVVYRSPPRPMYECVTPDGDAYTSDNGDGNPRWVPYWVPAYGYGYGGWRGGGASVSGTVGIGNGHLSITSGGGPIRVPPTPPLVRPPPPSPVAGVVPAGGAWVRDECHALPQQEVCARLSDRRYEILRRYHSAMPSERDRIDLEQRGIDARMADDCGTR